MKARGLLIVALTFSASFAYGGNYQFVAEDNSQETKICIAAGSDNQASLKRKLINYEHNMRYGVNTISCNGMSLAQFSHGYGAWQTHAFLSRHSSIANKVKTHVSITDLAWHKISEEGATRIVMVSAK